MSAGINEDAIYVPSGDIVSRIIEGELIIVPLAAGIGDSEDELFTMNETGRAVWEALDGSRTVKAVCDYLSVRFEAPPEEIHEDLLGLLEELLKRNMVVER